MQVGQSGGGGGGGGGGVRELKKQDCDAELFAGIFNTVRPMVTNTSRPCDRNTTESTDNTIPTYPLPPTSSCVGVEVGGGRGVGSIRSRIMVMN